LPRHRWSSIVARMNCRSRGAVVPRTLLMLIVAVAAACGSKTTADPNSREVPWSYGPTTGGATAEHVLGTGKKDGKAVARGWQLRLVDGKRLVMNPFQLASDHALFDKVALNIGLFDREGKQVGQVRSPTLTAKTGSVSFDLDEAQAKKLVDVVLYYVKA